MSASVPTDSPAPAPARSRGRRLLLAGLILPVLGIASYVVQLKLQRLMMPWYMPALALLGVVLVALSLWRRRTVWRGLALVVVLLVAAAELSALNEMRLPSYEGPIAVGRPFPAFAAKRANGSSFTQRDLVGDQTHAIVFFRGRW